MPHKLDTENEVFFYEQEFYVLSNFSAFMVDIWGHSFPTAEHAYHYAKLDYWGAPYLAKTQVQGARSAHDAYKIAAGHREKWRSDWLTARTSVMKLILLAKVDQHEYVKRKLMETGKRTLIEDSWRDDYWGWGPDKTGANMLGKIWMEIREDLSPDA